MTRAELAGFAICIGVLILGVVMTFAGPDGDLGPHDVVCVSGGMPVAKFSAQKTYHNSDGWRFVSDGIEYRTNLECIARPSP